MPLHSSTLSWRARRFQLSSASSVGTLSRVQGQTMGNNGSGKSACIKALLIHRLRKYVLDSHEFRKPTFSRNLITIGVKPHSSACSGSNPGQEATEFTKAANHPAPTEICDLRTRARVQHRSFGSPGSPSFRIGNPGGRSSAIPLGPL